MGIKNFRKFLETKIDEPIKQINFKDIKIKSVCIDINIFIYKFITAIRKTGKDLEHDGKIISHIIGLKNQINLFERLGIDIIYVFDGTPPKEKNKILQERKETKEMAEKKYKKEKTAKYYQRSFFINDEIIKDIKEYLKYRGIKYIDVDLEADIICASLVKNKIVDCVYTTDFDVLAYGTKCMISYIDYKKKYMEIINLNYMLKKLNINYEQFVEIVVASGCDYCDRINNMTLNKAYNHILENNNIKLNKCAIRAKNIFMINIKISKSIIKENIEDKIKLKKYLADRNLKI